MSIPIGLCDKEADEMKSRVDWTLLTNAMLSGFLAGIATRLFLISMPTLANNLGTDMVGISWALMSYPLAVVSLSLVFGRLGDLYGRQTIFALGFLIFTVASFLCGLSQNVFQLVLFRFFQGVGGAMTQSQSRALAMEVVPESAVGKAQGLITAAHQAGFLLGPSLGGLIIDYIHWRGIFFFMVPLGAVGTLVTWIKKKKSVNQPDLSAKAPNLSVDYLGAVLLILTAVTLISILDRRIIEVVPPVWARILVLSFIGSFLGFLLRESIASSPILHLSLFRIRMFAFSTLCLLFVSSTYVTMSFMLPFYLQEVLWLSPSFVGMLYLSSPLITMLLSPIGGYFSDRFGPTVPATAGLVMFGLSYLIGTMLQPDSHWLLPTLILVLAGVGDGLFSPPNHTAMISAVPKEHLSVASGALQMMFGLGSVLGISLGNFLLTAAFRLYTGRDTAIPTPSEPAIFVAALNLSFLYVTGIILVASLFSLMRSTGKKKVAGYFKH